LEELADGQDGFAPRKRWHSHFAQSNCPGWDRAAGGAACCISYAGKATGSRSLLPIIWSPSGNHADSFMQQCVRAEYYRSLPLVAEKVLERQSYCTVTCGRAPDWIINPYRFHRSQLSDNLRLARQ